MDDRVSYPTETVLGLASTDFSDLKPSVWGTHFRPCGVEAAIATCDPESGVDALFGVGGTPEGVIAAAAMRCMGGEIQGQLWQGVVQ